MTPASRHRVRLKYCAQIEMGQSPPSTEYSRSPEEGLPFLQGTADFGTESPTPSVYCESPTKLAHVGDILFSVRAPVGEFNLADQEFGIGRGLCAIRPRQYWDARFAWWALQEARHQLSLVSTGSTYDAVATEDVENLLVKTTSLSTQRTIADYLDRETARLNELVAEKLRLAELLDEKRRALITRAVTRGLDPNVPLRNSGISWLGEIPAHWETWKVGHLAEVGNGSTPSRSNAAYWSEGRIPWLNSSVVNRPEITHADQFVTELAAQECHLPQVKSGSVLVAITGQGKTRGRAAVLSFDATINQHLAFIHPNRSRLLPWFLRWTLSAAYDFLRSISDDTGGTKGALTCEEIANLRVPVPPVKEQVVILGKMATSVEQLDSLQAAVKNAISLIKERRSALISAAITGRLDIGNVA